jgi:hypothetical protein
LRSLDLGGSYSQRSRIPPLSDIYHAKLDLERLQFTNREIRQHADTLVRMLLECLKEPDAC